MTSKKTAEQVRKIDVRKGDCFNSGTYAFLVVEVVGQSARVRYAQGRRSTLNVRRLQREYSRCGEVETLRVRRAIAKLDAAEKRTP